MEQEKQAPQHLRETNTIGTALKQKFEAAEFPYSQFEKIGMTKKDVLSLPPTVLESLKAGTRTPLQNISITPDGMDKLNLQARLSIKENPDGSLNLNIHPIRKEISNEIGLTNKELDSLREGKVIMKDLPTMNGEMSKSIIQLDRETNEVLTTRQKNLIIPDRVSINEKEGQSQVQFIQLNPGDKESLKRGEEVVIRNPRNENEPYKVSLDLNSVRGLSVVKGSSDLKEDRNQNGIKDSQEWDINKNGIPDKKEKGLSPSGTDLEIPKKQQNLGPRMKF